MQMNMNSLRVMRLFADEPRRNHWHYGLSKQLGMAAPTLHRMLHALTDAGWLSSEREHVNPSLATRAPRTLYRITDLGIVETKKALKALTG